MDGWAGPSLGPEVITDKAAVEQPASQGLTRGPVWAGRAGCELLERGRYVWGRSVRQKYLLGEAPVDQPWMGMTGGLVSHVPREKRIDCAK